MLKVGIVSTALAYTVALLVLRQRTSLAQVVDREVFDVPRISHIVVDGKGDDWAGRGFDAGILVRGRNPAGAATDGWASLRLGWDERGLLVLLDVRDDQFMESDKDAKLFPGDLIKVFVYDSFGSVNGWSARVSPGMDPKHSEVRILPWDERTPLKLTYSLTASRIKTEHGYQMEMLLPWENLQRQPKLGQTLAFQIMVEDTDHPGQPQAQRQFFPRPFVYFETNLHLLRLAEKPSPALSVAAFAEYENFEYVRISLEAAADQAGKTLELRQHDKTLATVQLNASDAAHPWESWADVRLPLPIPPGDLSGTEIYRDGQRVTGINLPDLDEARQLAFARESLHFAPGVFGGETFPDFEFERPGLIEHLIGHYEAHVAFYDADHNLVTRATKPGRFGAVISFKAADGREYHKYCTLFHSAKPVGPWGGPKLAVTTMPSELGINPDIVQQRQSAISNFLQWTVPAHGFYSDRSTPQLLAWLFEADSGDPDPWFADSRWWAPIRKKYGDLVPQYLVQLPADYDAAGAKRWPLLLHLHASNTVGVGLDAVRRSPLPALIAAKKDFPFVVISPQCPPDEFGWPIFGLDALIDEVTAKYRIDPDRICVTGASMGGFGTWNLAAQWPRRFAAIAPIAGGLDPADVDATAQKLKDLPIWVFHGRKDPSVSIEQDDKMVAALRKAQGRVRYTVFPDYGHVIAGMVYDDSELWKWLLAQRRNREK